jgi:hypothetical protein
MSAQHGTAIQTRHANASFERVIAPTITNQALPFLSFDLSLREHVIVAHAMVVLAYEEPGENVQNERLNGQAQAQIPSSWLQINGIPEEGAWELHYVTSAHTL